MIIVGSLLVFFVLAICCTMATDQKKNPGGFFVGAFFTFIFFCGFLWTICSYLDSESRERELLKEYAAIEFTNSQVQLVERFGQIWKEDSTYSLDGVLRDRKIKMNNTILRNRKLMKNKYMKDWALLKVAELELLK